MDGEALRIGLVCPYDLAVPGGVQSHVRQLADRLRVAGHQVLVLAPGSSDAGPSDGGAWDLAVPAGMTLPVRFNRSVAPVGISPTGTRRALARLRRFEPDVVHVHEPAVPLLSLSVCLRSPAPLVGTFHAWSESDRLYRTAAPVIRLGVGRLRRRIAVSEVAAAYHSGALGLPTASFRVIPNGVDVERFATARRLPEPGDRDDPTLLFVGRLEPRKGFEQLIRAFVHVKARMPSLRLLVVGDGPERDRCQALLPPQLRSSVVFLGRVEQSDLPSFYAAADVVVAPALGGESFGIVLLEALAAGRPVVASAVPGYAAVVDDGVVGRLVPPGDVQALADAIHALLRNPSLRAAMGEAGREAARRYDWEPVSARIAAVYREALGTRVSSP